MKELTLNQIMAVSGGAKRKKRRNTKNTTYVCFMPVKSVVGQPVYSRLPDGITYP